MQESLQRAIEHHRRGELATAEALYAETVAATPQDAYALRCLASLLNQQGRFEEALACFERVLAILPNEAVAWNEHGSVLASMGRLDRALASFQRAAQLNPSLPEPPCNVGQALYFLGRRAEALPWLERALAGRPSLTLAHSLKVDVLQSAGRHVEVVAACRQALAAGAESANLQHALGASLVTLSQHSEALDAFDRALALNPAHLDAFNSRGNTLAALGRTEEALATFAQALVLKADFPEALNNKGLVLAGLERYEEALQCFEQALKHNPRFADAHNSRGASLDLLGRREEALASFDQALGLNAEHANARSNRGVLLVKLGRYAEGVECLDRALRSRPDDLGALNSRGNALAELGRLEEAFASFESALAKKPDFHEALVSFGSWLGRAGRAADAARVLRQAVELDPSYPESAAGAFYAAARCCDWTDYDLQVRTIIDRVRAGHLAAAPFHMLQVTDSPADQLACARIWVRDKYPPAEVERPPARPCDRERLRIAYLSPDFRTHPVARQACGLFERHDRTRFETIAVAFGRSAPADAMRTRLGAAFDHFLEIPDSVPDHEIARQLRDLNVAIAVDLAGYTTAARPGILALRPAPIQVGFLGYPGTLGAEYVDYLIADATLVPPGQRPFYSERIVHMPRSFFVTDDRSAIGTRPSRQEAGLPEEAFVFCCFNQHQKITPTVFDVWMRILRQVEGSVLWLSEPNVDAANNLRREAAARGIPAERILFAPKLPDSGAHLARVGLADLFLDTLPYNAHATACDALRAGLPVLTCPGESFAGRVAASLVHAVGLPELIVDSLPAYEALACELARDRRRLAQLRERLSMEANRRGLFDTDRFRRELEWAYRAMWERCLHGEPAVDFDVPADLEADRSS